MIPNTGKIVCTPSTAGCDSWSSDEDADQCSQSSLGSGPQRQPGTDVSPVETDTPSGEQGPRVAIIDDNELVAEAIERLIGHRADTELFTSPRDFLDTVDNGVTFDLIFCDLIMPQVSGVDVYDHLQRHHPELIECMVIVTGGATTPWGRDFLRTVELPLLLKPVERHEILEWLETLTSFKQR